MKKRRIVCLVLTLIMICGVFPMGYALAESNSIQTRIDSLYKLFQDWRVYNTGKNDGEAYFLYTNAKGKTTSYLPTVSAEMKQAGFIDFSMTAGTSSCYAFARFGIRYIFGKDQWGKWEWKKKLTSEQLQSEDTIKDFIMSNARIGDYIYWNGRRENDIPNHAVIFIKATETGIEFIDGNGGGPGDKKPNIIRRNRETYRSLREKCRTLSICRANNYDEIAGREYVPNTNTAPQKVSIILKQDHLEMHDNICMQLTATTTPAGQPVTWKSSNKKVATVNQNGLIEAQKPGKATISASFTYNKKKYTAECAVTVTSEPLYATVSTNNAEGITATEATLYGSAKSQNAMMTECGMLLGTSSNSMRKLGSDKINKSTVTMWFDTMKYSGQPLQPSTTYYYQAYVVAGGKTYPGEIKSFTTPAEKKLEPSVTVTTTEAKNISATEATLYGSAKSENAKMTECGMLLGTSSNSMRKLGSDKINKSTVEMWFNTMKYGKQELSPGTTYYYQAYVVVGGKTYSGEIKSFTTPAEKKPNPSVTVTTTEAKNISATEATLYGTLRSDTNASECGMLMGTSSGSLNRLGADSINKSSTTMYYNTTKYGMPLSPGTTYYYQAYAVVGGQTFYGSIQTFTTPGGNPNPPQTETPISSVSVSTNQAEGVTATEATLHGSAKSEKAKMTECGMLLGTSEWNMAVLGADPINTATTRMWFNTMKYGGQPLQPGTTYYYQAYVVLNGQRHYGEIKSFTTPGASQPAPAPQPPAPQPPAANTRIGVVTGTGGKNLAINSGPSSKNMIGNIPAGAQMTVYLDKTSGSWYWVEYNGLSGYAYKKFITLQ